MRTLLRLILSLALCLVWGTFSLVGTIILVIAVCRVIGANPYDGYWMYGILLSPLEFIGGLYLFAKWQKQRKLRSEAASGFEVVDRQVRGPKQ